MPTGNDMGAPRLSRFVRAAAARLAFVAVLALLLVGGGGIGQAQDTVLVSNIGQTQAAWNNFNVNDMAQEFTTGANAGGYTLGSIEIRMNAGLTELSTPTVKVFSGSATGTEVATLSGPPSLSTNTTQAYTFTASGVTLSASTKYWVVAEGSGSVGWTNTASDAQDTGGASDWSIADAGQTRAHDGTGAFSNLSNGRAFHIRVNGSPADSTAPTFHSATVDGTSVVITLSEDLAAAASLANSAFTVERTRSGTEAAATLSSTAPVISGNTVTLTLATASAIVATDTDVKVTYTKPGTDSNNRLEDSAGNEVESFTDQSVANLTGAATFVKNLSQTLGGTTGRLGTIDRAQAFNTGDNTAGYTLASVQLRLLTTTGTTTPRVRIFSGSPNGTEVAELKGPIALDADTTKNYTFTGNASLDASTDYWVVVEDAPDVGWVWTDSNSEDGTPASGWTIANGAHFRTSTQIGSFSTINVKHYLAVAGTTKSDTTAPTFHSATVNAVSLEIAFTEDLAAATSLANSSFTVKRTRDGNEATVGYQAAVPAISGNKVTLTLASGAILETDTDVKVSYTKPSTDSNNRLEDAAGNEVETFTDQPATNLAGQATFVKNVLQTLGGTEELGSGDRAQAFNTGDNPAGYTLASVQLWLAKGTVTTTPKVRIFSGSANGTEVAELKGPIALDADTTKSYTFTGNASLDASTDYWVVVEGAAGVDWLYTLSDAEDGTPASGWTIADGSKSRPLGHTGSFGDSIVAYMIEVAGTTKPDTTAPTFDSATVDGDSLVITFSEDLAAAASLANSAFTVERTRGGTEAVATLSSTAPVISGKTVTLTLATSAAILSSDTGVKVTYTKPGTDSNNRLEDAAGNEVDTFTDQPVTNNTGNSPATGAPAITAPNVFRVPAELGVDLSGIADSNGVTGIASSVTYRWQRFAADGTTLEVASLGTGSTYTLTDADAGKRIKVAVSFTDDGGNAEGPLASAATSAITAAASCSAPTLTGGAVFLESGRKLAVGRSGSRRGFATAGTPFGALDDRTFSAGGQSYTINTLSVTAAGAMAFTLDGSLSAAERARMTLHVCDSAYTFSSAGHALQQSRDQYQWDPSGQNWSPHAERTIYLSRDAVAPRFVSATVDGTELVITFSEDLASSSTPSSAFQVRRTRSGSTAAAALSSAAPVISGRTVTFTLATAAAILATDTNVRVAYTRPTSNGLKDSFGNEVASFTNRPVTNKTGVVNLPATGAPEIIAVGSAFRVPAVLRVDLSGIADANGVRGIRSSATYQWQRLAADGTLEVANLGTGSTYTLTEADALKRIRVQVRFTDDQQFSEGPLASDASPLITVAPTDPVDPHYVLQSELMRRGNIRNCSTVESQAAQGAYAAGTNAENARVNGAVGLEQIGGGLSVGVIHDPSQHAEIRGQSGDYCWLRDFNWIEQSQARSPTTPPRMPSRSRGRVQRDATHRAGTRRSSG